MSMRVPLLLVALFAILATLFFVLQADEQDLVNSTQSNVENEEPVNPASAGAPSTAGAADEVAAAVQGADTVLRDEVRTGHRIQVLDLNGSPAAKVRVAVLTVEAGRLEGTLAWWHTQPDAVGFLGDSPETLPTTDEQGFLQTDSLGTCVFYVAEFGRVGKLLVEESKEATTGSVHTMQLRAVPMREVRVLESNGEPTKLTHRLRVQVASAGAVAKLPSNATNSELSRTWPGLGGRIGRIADGREMFVPFVGKVEHERLGDSAGPFLFRIELTGNGIAPQAIETNAQDTEPIEFRLPDFGELVLRIEGAPAGLYPILMPVGGRNTMDQRVLPDTQDDGSFLFTRVAIRESFEIGAMIRANEKRRGYPARLELGEISGPTRAGERIEKTLQYQHPPGFYGRLILPEGVDAAVEFDDLNRGFARVKILLDQEVNRSTAAPLEVFPDGTFSVSVRELREGIFPISAVTRVQFLHRSEPKRGDPDYTAEDFAVYWADVAARIPSKQASVDLGEIELQLARPLLEVVVRNAAGEPLKDADIRVARKVRSDLADENPDAFRGGGKSGGYRTDAEGRALISNRDWFAEFGLEAQFSRGEEGARIEVLQVNASHPDATMQRLVIPASQEYVELTLAGSGSIAGSFRPPPGVQFARVAVVPPGGDSDATGAQRFHFDFRRESVPLELPFELESIPAGLRDVVFRIGGGTRAEILRVPSVQVTAGETSNDPRLQDVVLAEYIDLIRIAFFDANGRRFSDVDRAEFAPRLTRSFEGGGSLSDSAVWLNDEAVIPVATGETLKLHMTATGWILSQLGVVGGGLHRVEARRAPTVKLVFQGWDRLPAGIEFRLEVDGADEPSGSYEQLVVDGPEVDCVLPAFGTINVGWGVRKGANSRFGGRTEFEAPFETAVDGARIEVAIPERVFEVLKEL